MTTDLTKTNNAAPLPTGGFFPFTCVIVSTRNRGAMVAATIKSILESAYPNFELQIVDQSDNDLTEEAVKSFLNDPRLFYTRSSTRGVSKGRNLAIDKTEAEFIAITDDDCVVPPSWVGEVVKGFQENSAIGVVIGNLIPAEFDPSSGYIPGYVCQQPYLIKSTKEAIEGRMGWGGCMAIRRSVWQKITGFDVILGVGGPLKSGEDRDLVFRALSKGYFIYFTPKIWVTHYGFRKNGKECRKLAYRERFGGGAIVAKHLKFKNWKIVSDEFRVWYSQLLLPFLRNLIIKRSLEGLVPMVAFWIGLAAGFVKRVDLKTGNFRV